MACRWRWVGPARLTPIEAQYRPSDRRDTAHENDREPCRGRVRQTSRPGGSTMPDRRELELGLDRPRHLSRRALLRGVAAVGVAAAGVAACGDSASVPQVLTVDGVARAQPATDAPTADACRGMTALAQRMLAATRDNRVVSPLSIAYAFAMARAGAAGT